MKYSTTITITAETDGQNDFQFQCRMEPQVIMDPDVAIIFHGQIQLATRLLLGTMVKNGPAMTQKEPVL